MSNYQLTTPPTIEAPMLIRKPAEEVFEAFANPDGMTKFWFTKSSGRIEPGAELVWGIETYNVFTHVKVEEVKKNKYIRVTWNLNEDNPSTIEWRFFPQKDGTTYVTVTNKDFKGSADQIVNEAINSMGGFSTMLASAKAWLEHGLQLNLIADHHPGGLQMEE